MPPEASGSGGSSARPVYRVGVIADTHGVLDPRVLEIFAGVDLILHGGDVGRDGLIEELEAIAPVHAVAGNVDFGLSPRDFPLQRTLETPAGRIAVTHGHLPEAPSTDLRRMVGHFKGFDPAVIVYGHSHIPSIDVIDGVQVFNPGSAGPARFGRPATVGFILAPAEGRLLLEHITLTP